MACGVVEGESAAAEVGERGGECEGYGLACGVGVEGEEGFGVGRRDGAGRPLGFEVGYESGVLGNGKGEGVVGDAVVPVGEGAVGTQILKEYFGGVALVIEAIAVVDDVGVFADDAHLVGGPLGEVGGEGGVAGDEDGAWVVGDAVVPVREVESGPWGGFDGLEGGVVVVGGVERQALCGVIGKELDMALVFGDNAERPPFPFISTT